MNDIWKDIFYKNDRAIAKRFTEKWLIKNHLYNDLMSLTSFLDNTYSISERVYCLINDIKECPICIICKEPVHQLKERGSPFSKYCSILCSSKDRKEDHYSKRDMNKAKEIRYNTMIEKYGVPYNSQRSEIKIIISEGMSKRQLNEKAYEFLKNKEWIIEQYKTRSAVDIARELNCDCSTVIDYCKKYGLEIKSYSNYSLEEREIGEWLTSLNVEFKQNTRGLIKGELDIYIPSKNIAIEFCGLYWHCELQQKNNNYHFEKYQRCLENDINLITIFEDEWKNKNSQVKQFIKARLGIFDKRIFARNCVFGEVHPKTAKDFFNLYHIQGSPNTIKYAFGLFFEGELLACVSFSKHHRNNQDFVLNRLAFNSKFQIVGGASKLIKNSIKEIDVPSIITWSDNRWSTGEIYNKCGFKFDGNLEADYSYVDRSSVIRKPKQSMRKSDTNCPENKTEHQWALENKWYRIYDCGKKRWKWIGI